MCGIVGIAANALYKDSVGIFEDLMLVSNLRGRWGAGICVVGEKKLMSYKTAWSGIDACDIKKYNEHVASDRVMALIGHTRWPTKGNAEIANAHPHSYGNVTGVHNGTLAKVACKEVKNHESDSAKFYKHVSEVGFKKAFDGITGAYAFVWVNHDDQKLYFIRNSQRPMWIAKVGWGVVGQKIIWASEKEMIEFICKRRNVVITSMHELPINQLWSIDVGFMVGDDFTVEENVFSGKDTWPVINNNRKVGNPHWGRGFPGTSTAASLVDPKKSYVFDEKTGEFIEKSSITNPPVQKVTLPRSEVSNEPKGKETLRLPHSKGTQEGVSKQQRSSTPSKISLGSNAASFLRSLTNGVSKAEADFYEQGGDNVVDLFQARKERKGDDGPSYEEKVDEEFNALLATKADGESPADSVLWEDLQYGEDSEKLVETLKGHYVPESEYKRLLSLGCVWYGEAADETESIYWLTKTEYIFAFVIYDDDAMRDLTLHYPNHPLMTEWLKDHEAEKERKKSFFARIPTTSTVH